MPNSDSNVEILAQSSADFALTLFSGHSYIGRIARWSHAIAWHLVIPIVCVVCIDIAAELFPPESPGGHAVLADPAILPFIHPFTTTRRQQ